MVRPHISVRYMVGRWYGAFLECGLGPEINDLSLAAMIDRMQHVCDRSELSFIHSPNTLTGYSLLRHELSGTFGVVRAKFLI